MRFEIGDKKRARYKVIITFDNGCSGTLRCQHYWRWGAHFRFQVWKGRTVFVPLAHVTLLDIRRVNR